MSYSIAIGEAMIDPSNGDGEDHQVRIYVVPRGLPEAPAFPNDAEKHSNSRSPAYKSWADSCRALGLSGLFYDEERGLFSPHPGCAYLTRVHLTRVRDAVASYRSRYPDAQPGWTKPPPGDPEARFCEDMTEEGQFDPHLARMMWCEWWFAWALANCKVPAIENG